MVGRAITGIGVGFAMVVPPVYAAELAPPSLRGRLINATEILINAGVVLGYLSAFLLHIPGLSPHIGWRLVIGLAALPALVVFVLSSLLPESPRWLAKQGQLEEARVVLQSLYSDPKEAKSIEESIHEGILEESQEVGWTELLCPSAITRRMLIVGLGCAFFQQACGSESMVYYSPKILQEFSVDSAAEQNQSTIFVGIFKLIGAMMGGPFLDGLGRRPGVVVSSGGVALSLAGLALSLQYGISYAGLPLLCIFMIFFELGLAGGAFVLGTEIYPVNIRAKALAMSMFTTRFVSGIVSTAFPSMVDAWTMKMTFWGFSCISILATIWALTFVHETKGMALEEVSKLFENEGEKHRSYGTADT
jgi:sugar porter (SP) family MFS transporter